MNTQDYDRFARWLGRFYEGKSILLDRDDIYQVAMIGLLKSYERRPDALRSDHRQAMRWAVLRELSRLCKHKTETLDDRTPAPNNAEEEVLSSEGLETIGWAMNALPDPEYVMVSFKAMGYNPIPAAMANGWSMQQASQSLRLGLKRLEGYVMELAGD